MNTTKLTDLTRTVFVLVGTVLTACIGLATFGFISNSKVHYANFFRPRPTRATLLHRMHGYMPPVVETWSELVLT